MEDQQAQETQPQGSDTPPPPPPVVVNEAAASPEEQPDNSQNTEEPPTVRGEPTPVVIHENESTDTIATRANNIAKWSNIIAAAGLILAGIIFYYTYLLFKETQRSTNAAVASAEAAQNTYKEQHYNDSVLLYIDSVRNHNDSINDAIEASELHIKDSINTAYNKAQFALQQASTQAQIEALREESRRFEVENQPFLQIAGDVIRFDTMQVGKSLTVSITVDNLGKYPAKILSFASSIFADNIRVNYKDVEPVIRFNRDKISLPFDQYITNTKPLVLKSYGSVVMSDSQYKGLKTGAYKIYVTGFMKYGNLLNNKLMIYKFSLEINFQEKHQGFTFLKNENEPFLEK